MKSLDFPQQNKQKTHTLHSTLEQKFAKKTPGIFHGVFRMQEPDM